MTSQEVFDTVAKHLFAQGCRATDAGGDACMYRGHGGTKCAIGALIPDDEYHPSFEGEGVASLRARVDVLKGIPVSLLSALQGVHDSETTWTNPSVMRARLEREAAFFALSPAILANLSFNRAA